MFEPSQMIQTRTLFVVLTALRWCHPGSSAGAESRQAAGEPRLVCSAPVYDFGSMDNRRSVTNTFVLENRGTAPLLIESVRACCGSSARLSSMTVPPGSNATMTAVLSLNRRRGLQVKTIYVMSNDSARPRTRFQLKGTAVAALDVHPDFLNFGRVPPGYAGSREISMFTAGGDPFRVTNVLSTVPQFAAEVTEASSNACRVSVRTVPPLPPGLTRGVIRIMTDYEDGRQVHVEAVATVSGSLLTIPREMVLIGNTGLSETVERTVVVRARDNKNFRIVDTELPNSDMEIAVVPLSRTAYRCLIGRIVPTPGLDGKSIVLITDRKGSERVEIPIRVIFRASTP